MELLLICNFVELYMQIFFYIAMKLSSLSSFYWKDGMPCSNCIPNCLKIGCGEHTFQYQSKYSSLTRLRRDSIKRRRCCSTFHFPKQSNDNMLSYADLTHRQRISSSKSVLEQQEYYRKDCSLRLLCTTLDTLLRYVHSLR